MKFRDAAVITVIAASLSGVCAAPAAAHTPAMSPGNMADGGPGWSQSTLEIGPSSISHKTTRSGFTADNRAFFFSEHLLLGPAGIKQTTTSSHS